MKKLLFALLALTSLAFVSCEGNSGNSDETPGSYTLKITPTTVVKGEEVTFEIIGDLSDFDGWQVCYTTEGTSVGQCLPFFEEGSKTQTINANLAAGTYSVEGHLFVGSAQKDHTTTATFTVTE